MNRKSLIEAVSPEAPDFIEACPPKSQSVLRELEKAEVEGSAALIAKPPRIATDPAETKEIPPSIPVVQQPAGEISGLLPQTFRLPQRLIEDLVRAGELRALSWLDREGNIWLPD
jgi:hypothetical protein